ncbi:hypothetical protein CBS101457_001142 [Exobasidium rhododendri]|nr:hypothetical protein CBS101457_001142 [Exobasidium rhododendri]
MTERAPIPAPLKLDEQDAVLRSRLAFNDRPLKLLLRKLTQIVNAKGGAELTQAMTSFRLDLDSYILQLQRIEAVAQKTTIHEVRAFEEKATSMGKQKVDTLDSIEMLKKELIEVQQDRKNKLEYDALASEIMKYGTREELEDQLTKLRTTLSNLSEESSKYSATMAQSKIRFEGIAEQLKKLRADVGFEVGERERREVERDGEGDAEEELKSGEEAVEEAAAAVIAADVGDEEEGQSQGKGDRNALNPSAVVFKPTNASRNSTPGMPGSARGSVNGASTKRRRSARRSGGEEDEEMGESGKKRSKEEGEMSAGEAEEEEEEGAA